MTFFYCSRRGPVQLLRYVSPSLDPDHVIVHDGVRLRGVRMDEGDVIDAAAAAWYQLRSEYAAREPGLQTDRGYPALTTEDAGGHVWLDRGGEAVEVDVTHFLRRALEEGNR